jgi:predicted dehydrogenase
MPALPSHGLALLGSCNLAAHLAAIQGTPGLAVVGCWGVLSPDALVPSFGDPAALLHHPQVRGVVVATDFPEREYWARQAILAGKHVLCPALPAASYQLLKTLVEQGVAAGVHLCLIPRLVPCPELTGQSAQEVLYFALRAAVPQDQLQDRGEGILFFWGGECLQLLAERYGALDSAYARTRSLGINRPEEDVASAQLRFRNGIEGLVCLTGLAGRSGVELEEWREGGQLSFRCAWQSPGAAGLAGPYREFGRLLAEGVPPPCGLGSFLEGLRWAEWFGQSARLDREIHADEVVHG